MKNIRYIRDMNKLTALLAVLCLVSLIGCKITTHSTHAIFVSPDGNDSFSGREADLPLQSIAKATEIAQPGDTIFLHPGIYAGRNLIQEKHGAINQPIVITSLSDDPIEFAIIDGESEPALNVEHEGFVLENCSWLNLERLVFQNCWTSVIEIRESPYISVKSCHFTTGKRIIHARGHKTHHTLVEDCVAIHPKAVWNGWSWEALHHGEVSYYNGALLHPNKSGGGHIMRNCYLGNVYNAFRTRPESIKEDGNTEVYGNEMRNIRDNEFEPESWAWNMHYAYNQHLNIHKMYSIDGVRGGNIYIYGNTYTQTTDPVAMEEVSGIFKYSAYDKGALTYPCYAFNNSYYTGASVLRWGESTNHQLRHFNNAYQFFGGEQLFKLTEWQPGFEFDYDLINQEWPENIHLYGQEKHGVSGVMAGFITPAQGQFTLEEGSPCIDAGKQMILPEFDWEQDYGGSAPDVGAYEYEKPIDGPPFRFIPSPKGAFYEELPRISKYKVKRGHSIFVNSEVLYLYFSAPLDTSTVETSDFRIYSDGKAVGIRSMLFESEFELIFDLAIYVDHDKLSMEFPGEIKGKNGQPFTYWGSAMPLGVQRPDKPDLKNVPLPDDLNVLVPEIHRDYEGMEFVPYAARDSLEVIIKLKKAPDMNFVNILHILNAEGAKLKNIYEPRLEGNRVIFKVPSQDLTQGDYFARIKLGEISIREGFQLK